MRTLIFSDTHLTGTFDQSECDYIVKLVQSVDKVIINGDFWDGYLTTFDKFLKAWEPLLAELARHDVTYILGNHDTPKLTDERATQFSTVIDGEYVFEAGNNTYRVAHGHRHSREFDVRHPAATRLLGWLYPVVNSMKKYPIVGPWLHGQDEQAKKELESQLISFVGEHAQPGELYVFGHSHLPSYSSEDQYLNPGSFRHNLARYFIIDDTGYQFFSEPLSTATKR
jgi:predicted phosphodiesterase